MSLDTELRQMVKELVAEEIATTRTLDWRWLTTEQAAELLGITKHRVAAKVREGRLPGRRYNGRTYVDRWELEKAIERARVP